MGEYVELNNGSIKIGTCENLFHSTYLELARQYELKALSKEKHDTDIENYLRTDFRFRFPFPDENHRNLFGRYTDYDRGILFIVPKTLLIEIGHGEAFHRTDHDTKQLIDGIPIIGYRLPCIQSPDFNNLNIEKYDWNNSKDFTIFEIVQQKSVCISEETENEEKKRYHLETVVRCPYCDELSRLSEDEIMKLYNYCNENKESFTDLQLSTVEEAIKGYQDFGDKYPYEVLLAEYCNKI